MIGRGAIGHHHECREEEEEGEEGGKWSADQAFRRHEIVRG